MHPLILIGSALCLSSYAATAAANGTDPAATYVVATATFTEGLAPARHNGKWGYLNQQQQWVVPAQYDAAQPYSHGMAAVAAQDRWGYIDTQGNVLVKPAYDAAYPFSAGGYAIVKKGDEFGVIDRFAHQIVAPEYDAIAAQQDGTDLRIDIRNGWIRVAQYRSKAHDALHWGIYNTHGERIVPTQYDNRDLHFSEGLAAVAENGKWGYVGYRGTPVIRVQYDAAKPFAQGYAAVRQHGKWGYINAQGQTIVPFTLRQAESYNAGVAKAVDAEGQHVLINLAGAVLSDAQ